MNQENSHANNALNKPKVKMLQLPIAHRVATVKKQFLEVQNVKNAMLGKQEPEETVLVHHAVLENTGLAK